MRRPTAARMTLRQLCVAAGAVATALSLAACSGSDDEPSSSGGEGASSEAPIVQPGRPGDPASTIDADDVPTPAAWNHSDEAFAQMMIPHHAQALEMSQLAMEQAADPQVVAVARRIQGAQGPEIVTLATWLDERSLEVPQVDDDPSEFDHGAHGHVPMAGMLTEAQMTALEQARGARFDRLFLEGMIRHHRGAVTMAEAVTSDGSDLRISEIAADVIVGQTAEIDRMRQLLSRM